MQISSLFRPDVAGLSQVRIRYQWEVTPVEADVTISLPLLILGVAGILNQNAAIILSLKSIPTPLRETEAYRELGIYSASMKIAIILIVMTQAFRYAFEPFIFAKATMAETTRGLMPMSSAIS